jgi:REP element-mobilizing transposase RayT
MPEHIHLLVTEPEVGTPSTVMQVLKQRTARFVTKEETERPTSARPIRGGNLTARVLAGALL